MKNSVTITTPIPTAEQVADRLGISKARRQRLYAIVDSKTVGIHQSHHSSNGQILHKAYRKLGTSRKVV